MKTVLNYLIVIAIVLTSAFAVYRGAGFTACNVDVYGMKADQISVAFSPETANAKALTCQKPKAADKTQR